MAKEKLIKLIHNYLDDRGYDNVRSYVKGSAPPPGFRLQADSALLKPDLSAEIRGKKLVYEYLEELPQQTKLVEKCRNYLQASGPEGYKLRLIVPQKHYDKVLQWINANRLEQVGLVRVNVN